MAGGQTVQPRRRIKRPDSISGPPAIERCGELVSRIRDHEVELERDLLARVHSVGNPGAVETAGYLEGLRSATFEILDFILLTIERGGSRPPELPPAVAAQVKLSARSGVSLDTILRRCTAGHALLVDRLIEEADKLQTISSAELKIALSLSSSALDGILESISAEYARVLESGREHRPSGGVKTVSELLKGRAVDTTELEYDFDGWHTALIACGTAAAIKVRGLARSTDCRPLLVEPEPDHVWAWLHGREKVDPTGAIEMAPASGCDLVLAMGEPGRGRSGWRLSHEQAQIAMVVALQGPRTAVRFAEVGLVATVARDRTLVDSLEILYLDPFAGDRNNGQPIKDTLRAYFAAGRNISSAAAALGLNRQTVKHRLEVAEDRLGFRIDECALELELALRLEQRRNGVSSRHDPT